MTEGFSTRTPQQALAALLERFNKRLQLYRDSGRYQRYFDDLQQGYYQPEPASNASGAN